MNQGSRENKWCTLIKATSSEASVAEQMLSNTVTNRIVATSYWNNDCQYGINKDFKILLKEKKMMQNFCRNEQIIWTLCPCLSEGWYDSTVSNMSEWLKVCLILQCPIYMSDKWFITGFITEILGVYSCKTHLVSRERDCDSCLWW